MIKRLKDGKVVARGFALCSNKEAIKKSFDEYAVLSMAQTRAIGKAYRNLIGWVMKLSGYEGTPSEEVMGVGEAVKAQMSPVKKEVVLERLFQDSLEKVKASKDIGELISWGKRLKGDRKVFTEQQQKELYACINVRIDKLQAEAEK